MKCKDDSIVELRAAIVSYPMPEPLAAGRWRLDTLYNVMAAVRSRSGSLGLGYAFVFRKEDAQIILAAIRAFQEGVIGCDPLDSLSLHGALLATANFVGASGAAVSAIGAIDLAIWDLKGKLLDMPVHVLLGSTKTRIPAYASGGSFSKSPDALEQEVREYLDRGFQAVKIKLPPDVKEACKRVIACRSWVGDGVKVLYDSNQQQTYKDAIEIGRCCADQGAYWYEEPLPFWQFSSYAELRRSLPCRVALGETFYGEIPFHDAVSARAGDVLMPNLHKVGGVTAWTRIVGMSTLAGIPLSSHTMPEVSAHVMSATPDAEMLEYMHDWHPLYEEPFGVEDGCIVISPDEPGFGLRPSKMVRHALELT